ncbi:hypothetical protein ACFSKY_23225 [Azotobacter chroococcum]|uniref:Uncharacterized protein n=1 Tax=Azotobacter chroococcum TaxID=353 RepID=A0A4V6NFX6_9GAMM|nr:hypothetical protein [Azotobacter chroococcum]TBV93288.1 hypothetical protein E0E53_17310 [Azotobacter chroococcum]TCL18325.1 hypothetical protein EV691_15119 [Azotobacter chroococcum]
MIELQHISRLLCSALAAALLVGCASKEPPGPQVTLQDPEQTPREKWSDAMKILRDDLGIKGQKDVPVETARQYGLIAGVSKPTRGNGGSMGDLAFGGVGAALFLIPTGEVMGPWQKKQAAAWVPAGKANSMAEAIQIAMDTWSRARAQAFADPTTIKVRPSALPDNSRGQFDGPKNMFFKNPTPPSGGPIDGPSFTTAGKYYGPIYLGNFHMQIIMDASGSDVRQDMAMRMLSKQLPDWFVIYNAGQPKAGNDIIPFPPSILVTGKEYNFVGK